MQIMRKMAFCFFSERRRSGILYRCVFAMRMWKEDCVCFASKLNGSMIEDDFKMNPDITRYNSKTVYCTIWDKQSQIKTLESLGYQILSVEQVTGKKVAIVARQKFQESPPMQTKRKHE